MSIGFKTITDALVCASQRERDNPGSQYIVEYRGKKFHVIHEKRGCFSTFLARTCKLFAPKEDLLIAHIEDLTKLSSSQLETIRIIAQRTYTHFGLSFPEALFAFIKENPGPASPGAVSPKSCLKRPSTDSPSSEASSSAVSTKTFSFSRETPQVREVGSYIKDLEREEKIQEKKERRQARKKQQRNPFRSSRRALSRT